MKLILFIILCMWLYSYYRFRSKMKYNYKVAEYLEREFAVNKNDYNRLQLACAYMEIQKYESAKKEFEDVNTDDIILSPKGKLVKVSQEDIRTNIDFCNKPLPWRYGAKDHRKSWLHNFLLCRFGRRRINYITAETILEVNSIIRTESRNS